MKTMPDSRASVTTARQTVQTLLLIILSLVGTWTALYTVPWQVSGDHASLLRLRQESSSLAFG